MSALELAALDVAGIHLDSELELEQLEQLRGTAFFELAPASSPAAPGVRRRPGLRGPGRGRALELEPTSTSLSGPRGTTGHE